MVLKVQSNEFLRKRVANIAYKKETSELHIRKKEDYRAGKSCSKRGS